MIYTVEDVFGIGKAATEGIKAGAKVKEKELDNRAVRAVQRETTNRKKIQANVDKVKIIEENKTKRARSLNELGYRYIDESSEILTADDRPFFRQETRRGNTITKKAVSNHNIEFLLANFAKFFKDFYPAGDWASIQLQNQKARQNKMEHMEFMARSASAGDLNYSLPEGWGESPNNDQDPNTDPLAEVPLDLTKEEIKELPPEQRKIIRQAQMESVQPGVTEKIEEKIEIAKENQKLLDKYPIPRLFGNVPMFERDAWVELVKRLGKKKSKKAVDKALKPLQDLFGSKKEQDKNKDALEDIGAR